MTVRMSEKHQVTIPYKIAIVLGVGKGSLFDVSLKRGHIELIPLLTHEKAFTRQDYKKMDKIANQENGKEKKVTKEMISRMKAGKV